MVKKKILEEKEKFLRQSTAEEQLEFCINDLMDFMKNNGLKESKNFVFKKVFYTALKNNMENDIEKVVRFLISYEKFKPNNSSHFWGYLVRTFQYPPFEPTVHFRERKGKKRIEGREWQYLMSIKRSPKIIEQSNPDWLGYSLTYNKDFANVYTRFAREAREQLKEMSTTEAKDKNYVNFGVKKPLIDIDLEAILKKLEES